MIRTRLTGLLGIDHPIIQAGMGSEAGPELASAVSEAGALGTLGTVATPPDRIAAAIARTRDLVQRPFAVNVVTFETAPFRDEHLALALAERLPLVTLSFGDFVPALTALKGAGSKVLVQVQDMTQARAALAGGADVVIAQGNEAGGHTGLRGTLSFAAQVLRIAGDTPVVVAGGIADGRGLAAALGMGADGVVMGTRFKATAEFRGNPLHQAAICQSDGGNTIADLANDAVYPFTWPGNVVGRLVATPFTERWRGRTDELRDLADSYGEPYAILGDTALDPPADLNWAGESSGLIDEVLPAGQVVRETVAEAERLLRRVSALIS